ncbi:MAG: hypothetical protein GDA35_02215 [Hyphomonadaceae bacterium]|nr:hypothetical protein [Hyphomonadaceae bacterium]
MLIKLHSQAATIPNVWAAIQASNGQARVLAERRGTTEQDRLEVATARHSTECHSHRRHRLQTTLTPAPDVSDFFLES